MFERTYIYVTWHSTGPETKDGISSMDEDLLNLLDNFPLTVPIPNWDETNNGSNGSPMLTTATNGAIQSQLLDDASVANSENDQEYWNNLQGSCLWSNMPTIY